MFLRAEKCPSSLSWKLLDSWGQVDCRTLLCLLTTFLEQSFLVFFPDRLTFPLKSVLFFPFSVIPESVVLLTYQDVLPIVLFPPLPGSWGSSAHHLLEAVPRLLVPLHLGSSHSCQATIFLNFPAFPGLSLHYGISQWILNFIWDNWQRRAWSGCPLVEEDQRRSERKAQRLGSFPNHALGIKLVARHFHLNKSIRSFSHLFAVSPKKPCP